MYKENLITDNELGDQELVEIDSSDPVWKDATNSISLRKFLLKGYRLFKDRLRGTYYVEASDGVTTDVGIHVSGNKFIFWNLKRFKFLSTI